jgi:tol-pal system protein YbgF
MRHGTGIIRWTRRSTARRACGLLTAGGVALACATLSGCMAPQLALLRSGLDSLRTQVDTLTVRDSVAYRVLLDTRRDLAEQRDVLLSTRATAGSTTQELFEQMSRLEGKLDEVMGRFNQVALRTAPAAPAPGGSSPPSDGAALQQLYDQAAQDLTQGRYAMALQGFREVVRTHPESELADNAQYGIGECFFAQAMFDSAATEYGQVESRWPQGEKVPAALYKLALAEERLDHRERSNAVFQDLIKRFPLSGEAQLARERLGAPKRR